MTRPAVTLHLGDCLDVLRQMPEASVDAVVTDPPYGLSFMGKRWDYDVPSVEVWAECLRVLKPGGHLLAFAGTRTQHRMAVRIEDAGFEIRDMIAWVYGSGFPKSLDVGKAIDRRRAEDVEPIRAICRVIRAAMDARGLKSRHLVEHFGGCHARLIDHWAARETDSQPSLPTWEQWETLRAVLGIDGTHGAEVWRLNGRKGQPGDAWAEREVVGRITKGSSPLPGNHSGSWQDGQTDGTFDITTPATDAARQWAGWGTALKPALEPITVARKPLAGTVAENVLQHGTGALNIDGCRVAADDGVNRSRPPRTPNAILGGGKGTNLTASEHNAAGRWPANLIHDGGPDVTDLLGDAARFFYGAKASRADREAGCDGLPQRTAAETVERAEGSAGLDSPRAGAGRTSGARNHHPTVKPTDLMRYLCRLVTRPGGVVLDPFMGSGSTGRGAVLEGFAFVGIEREADYLTIAQARIEAAQQEAQAERPQPSLFDQVAD